ncbi:MAG: acyl carrier protein [Microgenomates group bacterium]|jgi:acyl carrier protein
MTQEIAQQIIQIIAEQALLDPNDIALETPLAELGIDSLGMVEAIFAIEEAFDISVPFNANEPAAGQFDLSTAGSIARAVTKLVAAK